MRRVNKDEIRMLQLCGWIRDILEACPTFVTRNNKRTNKPDKSIAWDAVLGKFLGPAADSRKFSSPVRWSAESCSYPK